MSCATPVIGPALGFVGVGAASVLAGHVARATRKAIDRKTPLLESFPLFAEFSIDDAILDAFLGVTVFKVRMCSRPSVGAAQQQSRSHHSAPPALPLRTAPSSKHNHAVAYLRFLSAALCRANHAPSMVARSWAAASAARCRLT